MAGGRRGLCGTSPWSKSDAPDQRAGLAGGDIHDSVRTVAGEPVIVKEFPNEFLGNVLADRIAASEVERLIVVGMMTNMCFDATVREAVDALYRRLLPAIRQPQLRAVGEEYFVFHFEPLGEPDAPQRLCRQDSGWRAGLSRLA